MAQNEYTKAIELITYYTDRFPNIATPYNILGNAYKQLNDKKEAKKYYQKAIDLGVKNVDPRLEEYRDNFKRLKQF
jgi:tetratricopeptide (TPR) repeat protein